MTAFQGILDSTATDGMPPNGLSTSLGIVDEWSAAEPHADDFLTDPFAGDFQSTDPRVPARALGFDGALCSYPGDTWFGQIIVVPSRIDAGTVLATIQETVEIYNAYRRQDRSLDAFVNNVGAGVTITNLPSLPETIFSQDGLVLTVQIDAEGPANISGTLDFTFDVGSASVTLTGTRTIVFAFEPESPIIERLRWATDVRTKRNGQEQRASIRNTPRQIVEFTLALDGNARRLMETRVFDAQDRGFGVPIWWEPALLTSAVAPTNLTVNVDTTSFADFRVGGLAMVFEDPEQFEALEIDSIGATSITFTTPFTKSFRAGLRVLPVRIGFMRESTEGIKFPVNLQRTRVAFDVRDNDVDLSDTSAFPSFNSKVLLSEPNMIPRGTLQETTRRRLTVIDNAAGTFEVFSEVPVSRRGHAKTFYCRSRQRLWEVRQLLHALKGRTTSFYIPTFFDDLQVSQNVSSGDSVVTVENVGYARFVQERKPLDSLRLLLKDGTQVVRQVTTASEIDEDEEQINISGTWGVNATIAEVDRLEYVEKARMATDEATFTHRNALGEARVRIGVLGVLE